MKGSPSGSLALAHDWWNTRAPVPLPPLVQAVVDAAIAYSAYYYNTRSLLGRPAHDGVMDAVRKLRGAQGE